MAINFKKECVVIVGFSNNQAFEIWEPSNVSNYVLEKKAKSLAPYIIEVANLPQGVEFVSAGVIRNESEYREYKDSLNGASSYEFVELPLGSSGSSVRGIITGVVEHAEFVMDSGRVVNIPSEFFRHGVQLGAPILYMANDKDSSKMVCFQASSLDPNEPVNILVSGDGLFEMVLSTYNQAPGEKATVVLNGNRYFYKKLRDFSQFEEWLSMMISK